MGAAMLGGVGGHAGLFSNANDLAKIMQLYLNKGEYAGKQFFSNQVIEEFTKCHFCDQENRRGIGFDKPALERSRRRSYMQMCLCRKFWTYRFYWYISMGRSRY